MLTSIMNVSYLDQPYNVSEEGSILIFSRNISLEDRAEDDYIFDDPKLQTILLVLYSLVFFFCFLGNLTVVLVTKLHWKMRGVTKFCLGNLAFANLCVSIFCIYQNLSLYLMDTWIFGDLMCKMYHFINSLIHTASILILVVISVERYLAILHPLKCRRILTMRRLRMIISAVWIGSALLCSPRLYFIIIIENRLPNSKGEPPTYEVICSIGSSLFDSRITDWLQFLLLFFLPILVLTILYSQIAYALSKRQTFISTFRSSSVSPKDRSELPSCTISHVPLDVLDEPQESPPIVEGHSGENSYESSSQNISVNNYVENNELSYGENSGENFYDNSNENARENLEVNLNQKCEIPVTNENSKETCLNSTNISEDERLPGSNCSPEPRKIFYEKRSVSLETQERREQNPDGEKFLCGSARPTFRIFPGRKKKVGISTSHRELPNGSRHAGVVRMLVLIVVTFAICNLPFHLRKLYQHHLYAQKGDSVWTDLSAPFTFLLMYANCALNPFLYAFMSKSFRSCVSDLVKCKLRKPSSV